MQTSTDTQYKFNLIYNNDDAKKTISISIIALYRKNDDKWKNLPESVISNTRIRNQFVIHKDLLYNYIITKKYDVIFCKCISKTINNVIFTDFVPMKDDESSIENEKRYKKILYEVLENNN